MLKRTMIAISALMLLIVAIPVAAAPPEHSRGGKDNRGRVEIGFTEVEFKDPPVLRVSRDRAGDVRLSTTQVIATGSLNCPRCGDYNLQDADIVFDTVDLRIAADGSIDGRVEGVIILDQDGEGYYRVRWQGTLAGEVTTLDLRDGGFDFGNVHINGIAIDHVGAGLTDRGARSDLSFMVPFNGTVTRDGR
jgi:hypothetical protein